jgi:HK97 gp10 family phage protein
MPSIRNLSSLLTKGKGPRGTKVHRLSGQQSLARIRADISIMGDDFVTDLLTSLPDSVFRSVVKEASRKAMQPVVADARANAEAIKDTGLLAKSIGLKSVPYNRAGVVVTIVGPRNEVWEETEVEREVDMFGEKRVIKTTEIRWPAKYAHLVEFGTQPHALGKGSTIRKGEQKGPWMHPGAKEKPFLRPALEKNRVHVVNTYREEIRKAIDSQVKRAVKQQRIKSAMPQAKTSSFKRRDYKPMTDKRRTKIYGHFSGFEGAK